VVAGSSSTVFAANLILAGRTSPLSPYKGVPPPPGRFPSFESSEAIKLLRDFA